MKAIIIYSSQYGATRDYANWIGEDLKIDSVSVKNFNVKEIANYDTIILGSSIAAYKLTISNWLNKNWDKLREKKLYLFTVSGADPINQKNKIKEFISNSISKEISDNIKIFSFGGRMVFKKLPFMIRIMMHLVKNTQKDPEVKRKFTQDYDNVNRDNIIQIVDELKTNNL